ncbi:hypothetical protein ASZ90_006885 [hydrocarbon metagenome]|uniref:Uncharacterized protein n=1 Tax=hydrocarbon metagenome TaxID=938273 RepID=A0A0W8FSL8_9ZZZZ
MRSGFEIQIFYKQVSGRIDFSRSSSKKEKRNLKNDYSRD